MSGIRSWHTYSAIAGKRWSRIGCAPRLWASQTRITCVYGYCEIRVWTSDNMDGHHFPFASVVTFKSNGNIRRRRMLLRSPRNTSTYPFSRSEGWKVGSFPWSATYPFVECGKSTVLLSGLVYPRTAVSAKRDERGGVHRRSPPVLPDRGEGTDPFSKNSTKSY